MPAIERGVGQVWIRLLQPRHPGLLSDADTWAHHMLPWQMLGHGVRLAGSVRLNGEAELVRA